MHHGHGHAAGGGHHVDLRINLAQRLLQHHHGKHGSTGGHIAGAHCHGVGGHHAGTGVTLGGSAGRAGFQFAGGIQQLGAFSSDIARIFAGAHHLGQNLAQLPAVALGSDLFVHQVDHLLIIIAYSTINGEHTAGLAHAHGLHAGQLPVNVACQGGQVSNILHMLFAVEHGLIQVRNAPALGNVEAQQLSQFSCSRAGHGVAPGAETCQLLAVLIKGQIAMHHGGHAKAGQLGQLGAKLGLHVLLQVGISILYAGPGFLQGVGPHAVHQRILPGVVAGCDRRMIFANQHSLDTGRAQFNTQDRLAAQNEIFHRFIHLLYLFLRIYLNFNVRDLSGLSLPAARYSAKVFGNLSRLLPFEQHGCGCNSQTKMVS